MVSRPKGEFLTEQEVPEKEDDDQIEREKERDEPEENDTGQSEE